MPAPNESPEAISTNTSSFESIPECMLLTKALCMCHDSFDTGGNMSDVIDKKLLMLTGKNLLVLTEKIDLCRRQII